jgi:hypothetical protein
MKEIMRVFFAWIPLAVAVTGLSVLCYGGAQQVLRQSINDVPVQYAEDAAAHLHEGQSVADVTSGHVDIRNSTSPFVIIYDKDGKVLGGSGYLDGKVPTPPHGVFENSGFWRYGHSWQPEPDVRIDIAIVPYTVGTDFGFAVGGRTMRMMEDHVTHVGELMFQAWVFIMLATFLAKAFVMRVDKRLV